MAMFDWDDEELTNIVWGEARESDDDHIVPYPDQNEENHPVLPGDPTKKKMNHETAYVSPIEQKKPCTNTEHGVEVVGSCKYDILDSSKRFSNSWPDGSDRAIINLEKVDQDSMDTTPSNDMMSTKEDREQGDFIDYSWENIGSFDDLDRIFRNDNLICGVVNDGSVEEPWLSSHGVTFCTSILTPASDDSSSDMPLSELNSLDRSEIGAEFILGSSHSFVSVNETYSEIMSDVGQDEQTFEISDKGEACLKKPDGEKAVTMNELSEKGNNKRRVPKGHKCQKSEEKSDISQLDDLGHACSSQASPSQQFSIHYSPSMVNILSQQWQFQRAEPFQQKQFTGPHLSSTLNGNVFHYPAMSILPQFYPVEGNQEIGNADYPKKSVDGAVVKPPTMTPKEKIEKLRRRQQLRATLAIQKQRQQFSNRLSVELLMMEGENIAVDENLNTLPSLNHSTSPEVNDSSAVSIPSDKCSVEESALYQLQETISKLDIQIRLSIRDSLCRLAQSAIQRQCPSDTSNINRRDEVLGIDYYTHERVSAISDRETDTNPVDRTVAHLLFHKPLELPGKLSKKHDSPVSAYLSHERKPSTLKSLAKGHFSNSFQKDHVKSPHGSETLLVYFDRDQSKNSPFLDTLQNVSDSEAAESGLKCL